VDLTRFTFQRAHWDSSECWVLRKHTGRATHPSTLPKFCFGYNFGAAMVGQNLRFVHGN
jgi:hypothetical protein